MSLCSPSQRRRGVKGYVFLTRRLGALNMRGESLMKKIACIALASAAAAVFANTADAAAYIKFDGVDGESKSAAWQGDNALVLTTEDDPVAVGLLLPAVQQARESARRTGGARPRAIDDFEIAMGARTYVLHGAVARPTKDPHTVKVTFRCKDWTDDRTGAAGSDCPAPAASQLRRN